MSSRLAGFSLLESLLALVILAASALALYSYYAANINILIKSGDVSSHALVMREAVERLYAMNLDGPATGDFAVGNIDFSWTAEALEPARESQSVIGYIGIYRVGLYGVDLEARRGPRLLGRWRLRLVGHEQVRPLPGEAG